MFKIGDFSRLSQVSVKTLRYYDEIGLLKPAQVDPFTGYRFYSADQLPRLNRILVLKGLGLSLEQIAKMLTEELPPAQVRGMLRMKQAELQQRLAAEQAQLAQIETRLRQMEQEHEMSAYDVVLKTVEPLRVVALRRVVPTYKDVGQLFGELFGCIGRGEIRPAGPALTIYHDLEYRERDPNVEVMLPITGTPTNIEPAQVREIESEQVASIVHQGSYDTLSEAYSALLTWIESNNYQISGQNREVYLKGPMETDNPTNYVTEIQFPVTLEA